MIIEHLEPLKVWLVKRLEPICDADPSALAKYVIALAKKEKPEADLRALCEDQLDVFLGDETKLFVSSLFDTLASKSYVPPSAIKSNEVTTPDAENKGKKRKSFEESEKTEVEKVQKTENKPDVSKEKNSESEKENSKDLNEKVEVSDKPKNAVDDNDTEKSNKIVDKQLRTVKNDDSDMRSVSQDRSMKSVSPSGKGRHSHSSKKKPSHSPTRSSGRQHRSSRRDRSRREHREGSRERRTRRRKKEKCRDYEEKGFCMLGEVCPYDHGYDPVEVDDRNLPQMLSLAGIAKTQANPTQLPNQPLQILPNVLPGARPLLPQMGNALPMNPGLTTVQVQRPVASPAELSGQQVPIFRPRNPGAFIRNITPPASVASATQQASATVAAPEKPASSAKSGSAPGEPYNPEEPSIEKEESDTVKTDQDMVGEKTTASVKVEESDNRTQDELVRIAMGNVPLTPIVGNQVNNMFHVNGVTASQPQIQPALFHNPFQAGLVPQTYLPMTIHQQQYQMQLQQQRASLVSTTQVQQPTVVPVQTARPPYHKNTVLEMRKIPRQLNNIVKLSEHFQKFGKITKIQTPFDQDQQAALIEFSNHHESTAAYNAPEAILGNRFIKMFWHNPNRNQKSGNTYGNSAAPSAKTVSPDTPPVSTSTPNEDTEIKPKKVASSEELVYRNPKADPVLMQQEKKKELEKLRMELLKKKQTHYDELVKKQKDILAKLETGKNLGKDGKARLLKAFKHCDVAVQKLKKELMESAKAKTQATTASPVMQGKDMKKDILDKEMDIYHGNLEGEELLEAKRALDELKREAYSTDTRGRGYRGRGRGSWYRGRGRGRGHSYSRGGAQHTSSVDNRPKQVLVSGFNLTEKDDVLAHFATFGPLDRIEETDADKMILTFPTRKSAEIAAIQGADFNGKQLVLAWFTGQSKATQPTEQTIQRRMTRSLSQSIMEKDLDDELLELDKDEEELLLAGVDDDDEDEDMETNERSWRR